MERLTFLDSFGEHFYRIGNCVHKNEISKTLGAIEDILGPTYDLSRLKELVEADREGRCVVLPCKVGDTVYAQNFMGGNDVLELLVERISKDEEKVRATTKVNGIGMYVKYDWKMFRDKTYKTREAAEKTLEDQNG